MSPPMYRTKEGEGKEREREKFKEDSSASGHDEPWIQWFCGLKGHEMFCEVERSYIEDSFNLYGLRACVSNFSDCLDLILDRIGPDDDSDDSQLTQSACTLYGLIHARYIITAHGLDAMYNKYAAKEFGTCPLMQCSGQPVLPVSLKDEMGADTVKIYCPKCSQVYHPAPARSRAGTSTGVDGAAFGTTFPHLFLMTFANLVPDPLPMDSTYVPRVFGFRVHKPVRQRFNTAPLPASSPTAPPTANAAAVLDDPPAPAVAASAIPQPNGNGTDQQATASTLLGDTKNWDDQRKTSTTPVDNTAMENQSMIGGSGTTPSNGVAPTVAVGGDRAVAPGGNEDDALLPDSDDPQAARTAGTKRTKRDSIVEAVKSINGGGSSTPTFLMESAAKRRRRTTSVTASNNNV